MSDLSKMKPTRTVTDNSFATKLVDGASGAVATHKLTIAQVGDTIGATNNFGVPVLGRDVSGDYALLQFTANGLSVDPGTVTVVATDLDIRDLDSATDSVTAVATDFDIRDLTHVSDSVRLGDGTNLTVVASDGQLTVELTDAQGVYGTGNTAPSEGVLVMGVDSAGDAQALSTTTTGALEVSVIDNPDQDEVYGFGSGTPAEDSDYTFDKVISLDKTFKGSFVLVGSDYTCKIRVGTWDGATFTEFMRYYQDPRENRQMAIPSLQFAGTTGAGPAVNAIRVIVTNIDDDDSSDVAVNVQGIEE